MGCFAERCYGLGPARGTAAASTRTCFEQHRRRSIMIRFVVAPLLATTLVGALPIAGAQTVAPEDNRYQFSRVEDGYLRLDVRNGQVSQCSRRGVGWACA